MQKLIAITCVISWAGFWAFGYLALSAGVEDSAHITTAMILAAAGLFTGVFTYLKLARRSDPARWTRVRPPEGA